MVTVGLVRAIGPLRANHVRLWFVSAMLLSAAVFFGEWAVALLYIWPIAISGVVGIAVGDCLLFSALKRLGPSRNFVTFSSAAPFGALLAFLFYGEILSSSALVGCLLVVVAIMLASKSSQASPENLSQKPAMDDVSGSLVAGVGLWFIRRILSGRRCGDYKTGLSCGCRPFDFVGVAGCCRCGRGFLFAIRANARALFLCRLDARVTCSRRAERFFGHGLGHDIVNICLGKNKAGIALTLSSITPLLSLLAVYASLNAAQRR